MADMKGHNASRACLYNVRWQVIRVEMLDSWNSVECVESNIQSLLGYLNEVAKYRATDQLVEMTDAEHEEAAARYYRIINYMNAIRMGYSGQGLVGTTQDTLVKNFRDMMQDEQRRYNVDLHKRAVDNPEKVKRDLQALYWDKPKHFKTILDNLRKRRGNAIRRHQTTKHRSELVNFVSMMEAIK